MPGPGPVRSLARIGDPPAAVAVAVRAFVLDELLDGWEARIELGDATPILGRGLAAGIRLVLELGAGARRERAWSGIVATAQGTWGPGGTVQVVDPVSSLRARRIGIALEAVAVEEAARRILARAADGGAGPVLDLRIGVGSGARPVSVPLVAAVSRRAGSVLDEVLAGAGRELAVRLDEEGAPVLSLGAPGTMHGEIERRLLSPDPLALGAERAPGPGAGPVGTLRAPARSHRIGPGARLVLGSHGVLRTEAVRHRFGPHGTAVEVLARTPPSFVSVRAPRLRWIEGVVCGPKGVAGGLVAPDPAGRIAVRLVGADPPVLLPVLGRGQAAGHAWLGGFAPGDRVLVLVSGCSAGWVAGAAQRPGSALAELVAGGGEGLVLGARGRVRLGPGDGA